MEIAVNYVSTRWTTMASVGPVNLRIFFFRLTGNKEMAPQLIIGVISLVYPFDMEVLLLLILPRANVRLLPHHLLWRFPNWHPSWSTCSSANLSHAHRLWLLPPRSPAPFLLTNYRPLPKDFTLWHPGFVPILRLLRQPHKFFRIWSHPLPEKKKPCGCRVCVCAQHLNRCKTSTVDSTNSCMGAVHDWQTLHNEDTVSSWWYGVWSTPRTCESF